MEKSKSYNNTKFSTEVLQKALEAIEVLTKKKNHEFTKLTCELDDGEKWSHGQLEEFFSDYRKSNNSQFIAHQDYYKYCIRLIFSRNNSTISIEAPLRLEIESVFRIFEESSEISKLPISKEEPIIKKPPVIFVGHGRDKQWKDLKEHLQDKHQIEVEAYEVGSRAGHTIRDILETMTKNSSFAILVCTAEDKQVDGTYNPRLNVVHEVGLFQGVLGFDRAIVLLEDGTNEFSNLDGIQQIRFDKGRIKETFGEVLAAIKREFKVI